RIGESHDRRRGAGAFRVLDHPAILAVHHSDAGIGRTEVDADYFCHVLLSAKQAFKDPIPAFRRKPPFARNFASARRAPRHALVAAYIRSTNFGCKSPASPLRLPARAIQYGHCDPAPCHRHPAKGHIGLASGKRRASVAARWQRRIPDLRRIRVRTPAVGLALVLFIVIFAVAGLFVWQGYRDALVRGEQRAAIAAHTIAAHFQWIIEASRQALRRTDDTLGFRPQIWNHDGTGDISDAVAGLPETVDVRVFDAAGEEVLTTRPQAGELSVGDRPYFQELKSGRRLIVSRLLVDRVTGDASFVVAQRLEREGGFAGIAAIVIPSSLISEFWASLELGTDSTASIIRDDGWLVTRHPPVPDAINVSAGPLLQRYVPKAPEGSFVSTGSVADTITRLVGYYRVPNAPLIAVASVSRATALAEFNSRLRKLAIGALPVLAALVGFAWWVARLLGTDERRRAELESANEQNRLLLREVHHRVKNNLQTVASLIRLQAIPPEVRRDLSNR